MTISINGTGPIIGSDRASQGANSDITSLNNIASINGGQLAGFRNKIINGNFDIWQRALSFASVNLNSPSASYTADRWQGFRSGGIGGATFSRIIYAGNNAPGATFAMRMQRNSGDASTAFIQIGTTLETVIDVWKLRGKQVTLSFWAIAGADFSGGTVFGYLATGTGTDGNYYTGLTTNTVVVFVSGTPTTYTRYSCTVTLGTAISQLATVIGFNPAGTAGANDWVEISGVQLEVGPVATPFEQRSSIIELSMCQRYYETGSFYFRGYDAASGVVGGTRGFSVTKRVVPTIGLIPYSYGNASGANTTNITVDSVGLFATVTSTGGSQGYINWTASAEL